MKYSSEEIEVFLQVARDATLGTSFAERLGAVTEAMSALLPHSSLSVILLEPGLGGVSNGHAFGRNYDVRHMQEYADRYLPHDPMAPAIPRGDGQSYVMSDFTGSRYGRDPMTGEYMPAMGLRYLMGCSSYMPGGTLLSIAIHREKRLHDFSDREREILRLVSPDLGRAAYGAILREELRARARCGCADPGHSSGAALFGPEGEVVHADQCAAALLAGMAPGMESGFDEMIADVRRLAASSAGGEGDGCARRYRLADGRWMRVRLSRLGNGQVMVSIEVIRPGTREFFDLIADQAGLTSREREVAALAVQGFGNRRIGFLLEMSGVTAGVHLTRVYTKTKVPGRPELASLMLSGRRQGD